MSAVKRQKQCKNIYDYIFLGIDLIKSNLNNRKRKLQKYHNRHIFTYLTIFQTHKETFSSRRAANHFYVANQGFHHPLSE